MEDLTTSKHLTPVEHTKYKRSAEDEKFLEEYYKNLYDKIEKRQKFALQFTKEFQNDDNVVYKKIKE